DDGQLINSTRQWPRREANFADRDYFQHFRNADDRDLYVSVPMTSRLAGVRTLYFSRRINARNGQFAGAVWTGVEIKHLANIYESVGLVSGQAFLLLRKDGTLLWRYPEAIPHPGSKLPASSPFHRLVESGGGHFRSSGVLSGAVRLVSVR